MVKDTTWVGRCKHADVAKCAVFSPTAFLARKARAERMAALDVSTTPHWAAADGRWKGEKVTVGGVGARNHGSGPDYSRRPQRGLRPQPKHSLMDISREEPVGDQVFRDLGY